MKKADNVGKRLVVTAMLILSAVLLLLMLLEYVRSTPMENYSSSAPHVQATQLPNLPYNWLLNSGSQSDLEQLPGIGPVLAGRIIENRNLDGLFIFPEDMMEVKGIGKKTYEVIMRWLDEHPEGAFTLP